MVFVAGFVDSVAGGGGLITLPIFMLTGLPVHTAIATNKLSAAYGYVRINIEVRKGRLYSA